MYLLSCFIAVNGRVASNLQSIFCFKGEYDDDDADVGGDSDADSSGDDDAADNDNEIDDDDMSKQSNMV